VIKLHTLLFGTNCFRKMRVVYSRKCGSKGEGRQLYERMEGKYDSAIIFNGLCTGSHIMRRKWLLRALNLWTMDPIYEYENVYFLPVYVCFWPLLQTLGIFPQGTNPWYSLDRILGWPHSLDRILGWLQSQ
jgi:hypothetical protein